VIDYNNKIKIMAEWNHELTFEEWFRIVFTSSLLLIYLIFISRIAILLHKNNKKINVYVTVTLIFIGISIILTNL
jgi:hypothetical protein